MKHLKGLIVTMSLVTVLVIAGCDHTDMSYSVNMKGGNSSQDNMNSGNMDQSKKTGTMKRGNTKDNMGNKNNMKDNNKSNDQNNDM